MMKTQTGNASLIRKLQNIVEQEPNSLRTEVANEALQYSECSGIATFFSDLLQFGCISGMVGSLIYYTNTHQFFDKYYDEIEELRNDWEDSVGEPLQIKNDLKNTLAWFGFEETARQLADELGLVI